MAVRVKFNGLLLLDKPPGVTSHDVVAQVRKIIKQRRVGHTGTLDPLATGLLVVCIDRATKVSRFISELNKTYEAVVCLGMTSETYDAEGVSHESPPADIAPISRKQLETVLGEFTGVIRQKVPAYSAVRVGGRRLYELARKGAAVEAPDRDVEIKEIVLHGYNPPRLEITVTCSKGTYIRSLAHEIGRKLGCGGYLEKLERTSIGKLSRSDAISLERVRELHLEGRLAEYLLTCDDVLGYGAFTVCDEFRDGVLSGRRPTVHDIIGAEGVFRTGDRVFLKDSSGTVLAVGTAGVSSENLIRPATDQRLFDYIRVLN